MGPTPKSHDEYRSRHGFSLVEMSIVVAIIAVVATMGLEVAASYTSRTAYIQTVDTVSADDVAIDQFFRIYGRLPCPADIAMGPSDTRYGLEHCTGTVDGFSRGALPFRTLNLPFGASLDGYGSKIIYMVSNNLTRAGMASGAFDSTDPLHSGKAAIEIRTGRLAVTCTSDCALLANPNTADPLADPPGAAYAVYSSGADQLGAYSRIGTVFHHCIPSLAGYQMHTDAQNCVVKTGAAIGVTGIPDDVLYDNRYNNGNGNNGVNYFDDIIKWRPKARL